jgi:hypothetical protein
LRTPAISANVLEIFFVVVLRLRIPDPSAGVFYPIRSICRPKISMKLDFFSIFG